VNVRQAINHAIDRNALVKAVLVGTASRLTRSCPSVRFSTNAKLPVAAYDMPLPRIPCQVVGAERLDMTLEVGTGKAEANQIGQIIQQELAPLGSKSI